MIIDCGTCVAQHTEACDDCIVSALVGPGGIIELANDEKAAIDAMSSVGLVSPIRLMLPQRGASAS